MIVVVTPTVVEVSLYYQETSRLHFIALEVTSTYQNKQKKPAPIVEAGFLHLLKPEKR